VTSGDWLIIVAVPFGILKKPIAVQLSNYNAKTKQGNSRYRNTLIEQSPWGIKSALIG